MFWGINRTAGDQVISFPVKTYSPERISVTIYHPTKPNTVYFSTCPVVNGSINFTVKIPKCPEKLIMEVYNEDNGNKDVDGSFIVGDINLYKLIPNLYAQGIMDRNAREFAEFSDQFAEDAGILPAQNDLYKSKDGKFSINYVNVIRDEKGGEINTPARVDAVTREIENAKKYYIGYTVPGRKAINWHEYSHVYANINPADELEADKNAIFFYLALGNPKIEALNVFLKVFKNSPSDLNVKRDQALENYIMEFDKTMKPMMSIAGDSAPQLDYSGAAFNRSAGHQARYGNLHKNPNFAFTYRQW